MSPTWVVLILGIAAQLIDMAMKARATAAQNHEWTPEEEAVFDARLADAKAGRVDHWKREANPE